MNQSRLAGRARFVLCLAALTPFLTACAKQSRVVTGSVSTSTSTYAARSVSLDICSGYGCAIKDQASFTKGHHKALEQIMSKGEASAKAERKAIGRAIAFMERATQNTLRFQSDVEFSYQSNAGKRGQMDCVDESLNTIAYLKYLHASGWMRHHIPDDLYAERGMLLDGRFPHKSATMRDKSGKHWAVDSWKRRNGSRPEVVSLSTWYKQRNDASQY